MMRKKNKDLSPANSGADTRGVSAMVGVSEEDDASSVPTPLPRGAESYAPRDGVGALVSEKSSEKPPTWGNINMAGAQVWAPVGGEKSIEKPTKPAVPSRPPPGAAGGVRMMLPTDGDMSEVRGVKILNEDSNAKVSGQRLGSVLVLPNDARIPHRLCFLSSLL